MIKAKDVVFEYQKYDEEGNVCETKRAVDGVELDVKKGDFVAILGHNGSGKSTVTKLAKIIPPYINADDIKKSLDCSDLEAAQKATELREKFVNEKKGFTFETVLSTSRNLDFTNLILMQNLSSSFSYKLSSVPVLFRGSKNA